MAVGWVIVTLICGGCGAPGALSAIQPTFRTTSPPATSTPAASPTPSASASAGLVIEIGVVIAVDIYGRKTPMVKVGSGSPYSGIDVYGPGANKFPIGSAIRATGAYISVPPNDWIQAKSITLASGSPLPTPTSTPAPTSTPTPDPTPTPTSRPVINVIMMENHSQHLIIGSSQAPFINSLLARGAYFSNAHGYAHPSLPNYLVLFSGSAWGVTDDRCPPQSFAGPTLANQVSVGSSVEDAPSNEAVCNSAGGLYQGHHVPWTYFADAPVARTLSGNVNFIIPNNCDNMHDCSIATGDAWLSTHWPLLGTTILVWDEADPSSDYQYDPNNVALFIVGPGIAPHTDGTNIDHCAILKWIETQEHVPLLGCAATASKISP